MKTAEEKREYFKQWRARKLAEDPDWQRRETERVRAIKSANRERYAEINRQSDERIGVERARKRNRERMARHRERTRGTLIAEVRLIMRHAIRDGHVKKPTKCSDCHADTIPRRLHAHHNDYTKPYEVEWLCTKCHGKRHRRY